MNPLEIAIGIGKGVADLVQMGLLAKEHAAQAEAVMIERMKPTPSSAEVDAYTAAKDQIK